MVMQLFIVVGTNIAPWKHLFQMLEEGRIDGHHIFKVSMNGAILHHEDFAVTLNDLRLDLTDLLVQENLVRELAIDDLLPNFREHTWDRGNQLSAANPAEAFSF